MDSKSPTIDPWPGAIVPAVSAEPAAAARVGDYVEMTKPRIALLVLITTIGAMLWAAHGLPRIGVLVATLIGMGLASAGAGVLNHVIDRDIDRLMDRTKQRPVAAGRIGPGAATLYGVVLTAAAFVVLAVFTNWLATALALAGSGFYVGVYTLLLKRRTPQNIVIGGAAGAVPPLVGWAAVTGHLALAPLCMFAIIFLWTPPHFWALALLKRDDYARAGVPMLPVVASPQATAIRILAYTTALVAASLLPVAAGLLGVVYLVVAVVLGVRFLQLAARIYRHYTPSLARSTFLFSLVYLATLFAAMGADRVLSSLY